MGCLPAFDHHLRPIVLTLAIIIIAFGDPLNARALRTRRWLVATEPLQNLSLGK